MRSLLAAALAIAPLTAQQPVPGVPEGFRERVAGYLSTDPMDLWRKELKQPTLTAVVEILGELSREEKQQLAFEEMRARLLAELQALLRDVGSRDGVGGSGNMLTLARIRF
jgi:hypothetical protein